MTTLKRITINPEQCGGPPCIRGLQTRVSDALELLAVGLGPKQIFGELPDSEAEDVAAVLHRGAERRRG